MPSISLPKRESIPKHVHDAVIGALSDVMLCPIDDYIESWEVSVGKHYPDRAFFVTADIRTPTTTMHITVQTGRPTGGG